MKVAIWWIRRDARLSDNQALQAALAHAEQIIPVFVLDPTLLTSPITSTRRLAFLLGGLRSLDADLRRRGSRLLVRSGKPHEVLAQLMAESGADAVCAEEDFSPYARWRDALVAAQVPLHLSSGLTVHPPELLLKPDGEPYTVFTPFSKAWKKRQLPSRDDLVPIPDRIPTPDKILGQAIPDEPSLSLETAFIPSEAEARRRLDAFVGGDDPPIYRYADHRNRLDESGTSGLSPYLRFGMISARRAVATALAARANAPDQLAAAGAEAWLNELIWREFYIYILYHFPYVLRRSFRSDLEALPWINNEGDFSAWREGRTGYPVVDAAMRQLSHTGWMHNRARMIVASFLVKDLLIDWRWGERWFMQQLVDGDPAANNGGWQWSAGTGTDAAPYFRIFNPVLQGEKFDPEGSYVRTWVPELSRVPPHFIHHPWTMSDQEQRQYGCIIGQDYPAPIVDHGTARQRAMAAYSRSTEHGRALGV